MAVRLQPCTILTLTVAIVCSAGGVNVRFNTVVYGEETVNITGVSLADCVRQCDGLQGCTFVNFIRLMPLCQLIKGNTSNVISNKESYVAVDIASGLFRYLAECKHNGVVDTTHVCPEDKKAEGTTSLGNMNFEGATRVIRCNGVYVLNGLNVTTCTVNGTWSEHGQCVKLLTMREPCQSNVDCIDDASECRKGRCWCKPGLSHNPDNNSCVAPCPGRYGDTFQQLHGFGLSGKNKYTIYFNGNIDECMHKCLNISDSDYVCKYIDVDIVAPKMYYYLNEIPDDEAPRLTPWKAIIFLQRDCASSL